MNKIIEYIKYWLLEFTIVQLFLTLVSLPVIVAWGLPLSILSPLGNLIFSPFLTAFLLISSLIFFTEILTIPNDWLIWALEIITNIWQKLLSIPVRSCLFAFKTPSPLLLLAIGFAPLLLVLHPAMKNPLKRLAGLIVLFFTSWLLLALSSTSQGIFSIPCNKGNLTVVHNNNKTVIIDPGCLGTRISAPSYVAYTLVPELIKQSGSLIIDHLIITTAGTVLFQAIEMLNEKMEIQHIYMPYYSGEWDPMLRRKFNRLYAKLKHHNVHIHSIKNHPLTIKDNSIAITLTPRKTQQYRTIQYPEIVVSGFIDNKILNIYDAKGSPS